MNIIVTCGPSYEPIDQVRRITNFSTGCLGITLANSFTDAGHRVFCLKGEQATHPEPPRAHKTIPFSTNDDLAAKLQSLASENIQAIFHAAALCDYKVASVHNPNGEQITAAKIATREQESLTLTLIPTSKILPSLRAWFPSAKIVGWKYELNGSRDEALQKAFQQIADAKTDACVLNGAAYGPGFAFCEPDRNQIELKDLKELCERLLRWV